MAEVAPAWQQKIRNLEVKNEVGFRTKYVRKPRSPCVMAGKKSGLKITVAGATRKNCGAVVE